MEEQSLRLKELDVTRQDTETRTEEARAIRERNRLVELESQERQQLLESCKRLQELVAGLVERLETALEHSVVLQHLRVLQRDVRDLLGIMSSLTVAITGIIGDEDPRELRRQLQEVQRQVLEILGRSVEGGSVEFTNIHTDRDANIDIDQGG